MFKTQRPRNSEPNNLNKAKSQDFRLYLQSELSRRLNETPGYSLRSFAKLLEVDPSALAKLLKGHRPLGKRLITRFAVRLNLAPDEVNEFISYQEQMNSRSSAHTSNSNYQQITLDTFRLIADWYHYAILELIRVDSFRPDPKWISRSLHIPLTEVNFAIERMVRVGMLDINENTGEWTDNSEISTNITKPYFDGAQKRHQKQILEKAIFALENTPVAYRDQTSMTMAIDTERLPEAKERIKHFRRELANFLSRGETRDQVYHLSLSLYTISSIENEKEFKNTKLKKQEKK
jgi:uncharacterized protein (TIGR02147 family)